MNKEVTQEKPFSKAVPAGLDTAVTCLWLGFKQFQFHKTSLFYKKKWRKKKEKKKNKEKTRRNNSREPYKGFDIEENLAKEKKAAGKR